MSEEIDVWVLSDFVDDDFLFVLEPISLCVGKFADFGPLRFWNLGFGLIYLLGLDHLTKGGHHWIFLDWVIWVDG